MFARGRAKVRSGGFDEPIFQCLISFSLLFFASLYLHYQCVLCVFMCFVLQLCFTGFCVFKDVLEEKRCSQKVISEQKLKTPLMRRIMKKLFKGRKTRPRMRLNFSRTRLATFYSHNLFSTRYLVFIRRLFQTLSSKKTLVWFSCVGLSSIFICNRIIDIEFRS